MVVIKGPKFEKKKSQKAAKFVIPILVILISVSYVHEPIYRHLIDEENDDNDNNERRIWCIVSYPSNVEDISMNERKCFHFNSLLLYN
jgi:hypothetical protein